MLDNWFAHFIAIRCLKYTRERPTNKSWAAERLLSCFIVSKKERARENCHCVRSAHVFAATIITVCFHVFILIRTSTSMMYYYYRCLRRPRRHCVFAQDVSQLFLFCALHSNPQMNYLSQSFSSISDVHNGSARDANSLGVFDNDDDVLLHPKSNTHTRRWWNSNGKEITIIAFVCAEVVAITFQWWTLIHIFVYIAIDTIVYFNFVNGIESMKWKSLRTQMQRMALIVQLNGIWQKLIIIIWQKNISVKIEL